MRVNVHHGRYFESFKINLIMQDTSFQVSISFANFNKKLKISLRKGFLFFNSTSYSTAPSSEWHPFHILFVFHISSPSIKLIKIPGSNWEIFQC